jgi:hypothetical protein
VPTSEKPTELSIAEKNRITRDVSLGVTPPENESDAARKFRESIENQIDAHRDAGVATYIPFDLEL